MFYIGNDFLTGKLPYQVGRIYFFDPVSLLTNNAGDNMELLCF